MKKLKYPIIVGIINVVFIFFIHHFHSIELTSGLPSLYSLRDLIITSSPPSNIVNIQINQNTFLELPESRDCLQKNRGAIDMHCLSRRLHGDLIRKLHSQGASLIVFNLLFRESRGVEDRYFADAIHAAGNVLLQDYQEKRFIGPGVEIVDVTPPVPPLDESTLSAPLPIPDSNAATPRFWMVLNLIHTEQESAQSYMQPILPVVALHLLAIRQNQQALISVFQAVAPTFANFLSKPEQDYNNRAVMHSLFEQLSNLFKENPGLGTQLSSILASRDDLSAAAKQQLQGLFRLYQIDTDFYLNPYGPAKTIPTLDYHQVDQAILENPNLFRDQVVFIGPSLELGRPAKGGMINTPYGHISSTELLASVFANLRDAHTLRPVSGNIALAITFAWWLLVLGLQIKLRPRPFMLVLCGLTAGYFLLVLWLFSFEYLLLPWLLILLLSLTGLIVALVGRYLSQRNKLSDILNANLPPELVSVFSQTDFEKMQHGANHQGVCLAADGEGYTKLGETKGEQWLAKFMLAYQPVVEQCVRNHKGAIKDWAGDGVVALWIESPHKNDALQTFKFFPRRSKATTDIRKQALHAALALVYEIKQFNQTWDVHFPLRIGLSYGPMWLSFVDELKAFGDTINTASRIESLNKETHTRILVTEEMIQNQPEFVTRRVGRFLLRGHQQAINIFELMGIMSNIDPQTLKLISKFEKGLRHYENEAWQPALLIFSNILSEFPNDGPSQYYYQQCCKWVG